MMLISQNSILLEARMFLPPAAPIHNLTTRAFRNYGQFNSKKIFEVAEVCRSLHRDITHTFYSPCKDLIERTITGLLKSPDLNSRKGAISR
jgi:hypothetical protein